MHFALSEIENLQGARQVDEVRDIVGDDYLRADNVVYRDSMFPSQLVLATQVTRGTNTTDLLLCLKHGIGNTASNHVDFITVGYSDDHVSVLAARFLENIRVRGLANNGAYIDAVL